jgi:predicted nucleotidyltransferase
MNNLLQENLINIQNLLRSHKVEKAFVFGSMANNTATSKSDVDFLVSFNENLDYETYADNYFNLLDALRNLLKKDVDIIAEETLSNPYLIQSINNNKVQLI